MNPGNILLFYIIKRAIAPNLKFVTTKNYKYKNIFHSKNVWSHSSVGRALC